MGIVISRFRKKKTTLEVLESIDAQIREIKLYGQSAEQRHKKIVGTLIVYSSALYVLAALIFYFYFFPSKLQERLLYATPLLLFPLLILLIKMSVSWYYKRKIMKNQRRLASMQREKSKILDQVTETETYKKAKEILMKFAPDQLRLPPSTPTAAAPILEPKLATPLDSLRRRTLLRATAEPGPTDTPSPSPSPAAANATQPRTPLPRPILPQKRSYMDRVVEYIVGDGLNNRYALICRQCDSHNGMALREEFEYFAFRCCYCNVWNPARKQKPSAPKLLEFDSSVVLEARRLSLRTGRQLEELVREEEPPPKVGDASQEQTKEHEENKEDKEEEEEVTMRRDGESKKIVEQLVEDEGKEDAKEEKKEEAQDQAMEKGD